MKVLMTSLLIIAYINIYAQVKYRTKIQMYFREDTTSSKVTIIKKGEIIDIAYLNADYWKIKYKNIAGYLSAFDVRDDVDFNLLKGIYFSEHPPKILQTTSEKAIPINIKLGMSDTALQIMLGMPSIINKSVGSWGTTEQWVYDSPYSKSQYYYFTNGKLTSYSQ